MIVYTARHDRVDNFWFTLAHEIAHVLLHLSADAEATCVDDLDTKEIDAREREADEFAEKTLRVDDVIGLCRPYVNYFSERNLRRVAAEVGMEPSLVLGILQYHGLIEYWKLNRVKRKVKGLFPERVVVG